MRRIPIAVLVAVALVAWGRPTPAAAQVTLVEVHPGGGLDTLHVDKRGDIVDINATLRIVLDPETIHARAADLAVPPLSVEEVATIEQFLAREAELLAYLGPCRSTPEDCDEGLRQFSSGMNAFLGALMDHPTLREAANMALAEDDYAVLFDAVRAELERMTEELQRAADEEAIRFRLGGWVVDRTGGVRPIHVPGFDNHAEGTFYEAPFLIRPTTEELAAQLENLSNTGRTLREEGQTALSAAREQVGKVVGEAVGGLACVAATAADEAGIERVDDLAQQAQAIIETLGAVWTEAADGDAGAGPLLRAVTFLARAEAAVSILDDQVADLARDLDSFIDVAGEDAAALRPCLEPLEELTGPGGLVDALARALPRLRQLDVARTAEATLEFDEAVRRLALDEIPPFADVDLRRTGVRQDGDAVVVRAVLERPPADGRPARTEELERVTARMYRIAWYAKISATAAFVNPFADGEEGVAQETDFQLAPSTSIVVRRGLRGSALYNTFWNVGLGLHAAAPDADLDGTPELGLGLVVTTAADYLNAGLGWNLGLDVGYWFFGLQLPVGILKLPTAGAE